MESKNNLAFLSSFLSALVGILILVYVVYNSKIDFSLITLPSSPLFLLFSFIFTFFNFTVLAFRLDYFLKVFNSKSVSMIKLIRINFLEKFALNFLPSRLNIPVKVALLYVLCECPKSIALSITGFEFVIDLGISMFFAFIGVYIFFSGNLPQSSINSLLGLLVLISIFMLAFIFFPRNFFQRILQSLSNRKIIFSKWIAKGLEVMIRMRDQWLSILHHPNLLPIVFISFFNWVIGTLAIMFIFNAYNYSVPFTYVLVINAISVFIGGISQTPGGIGTREASFVFFIHLAGYSAELALINVILARIFTYLWMFIGYLFSLPLLKDPKVGALFSITKRV